ncbi:TraR/DksA family transcriptional regulator [Salmonella enterica]|nr:TraR/DksA family transcriptional regulator [Salmonella enterica]EJH7438215.1 TraR/DksA family transcriptional regulator [Salmonella enterica]EJH7877509.1 TraR/DksA family transcriptional regulator [Salmonella enterica]EJI6710223.1 TraR/DksA family transcriptional regulator [Salmonella enterica]
MTAEIIDQASELEEMLREQAIAAHRINRNAVSATHCVDCGESIPDLRREKVPGCQRCADCQCVIELKNKQRGNQ